MDAAWKTEFFAYVISRKRKANQREKIQGDVFLFNSKPHAKTQALLREKKEKTQNRHLGAFSTSLFNCYINLIKFDGGLGRIKRFSNKYGGS